MNSSVLIGLAVTSKNNSTLCTATFDNVQVMPGTSDTFVGAAPTKKGATKSRFFSTKLISATKEMLKEERKLLA
jgi:hypothetical protein